MKYAFVDKHREEFGVAPILRALDVSRSGFYAWRERMDVDSGPSAQAVLDREVRAVFEAHFGRYGAIRVTVELRHKGFHYDRKTVAKSLRRQGLRARAARKFIATTNSDHGLKVAPNLLEQDFSASAPNLKFVQDITYLPTDEGWLYLAVVVDLYSRQVVGWAMDKHMKAGLVCDALKMALWRRGMPRGVIVHSDRGSQYCSNAYQEIVNKNGLLCSMSKRGDCYDNACAETFFHTLKVELTHGVRYETRSHMRQEVFQFIETYYNTIRRHSTLGYVSPAEFEMLNVA